VNKPLTERALELKTETVVKRPSHVRQDERKERNMTDLKAVNIILVGRG